MRARTIMVASAATLALIGGVTATAHAGQEKPDTGTRTVTGIGGAGVKGTPDGHSVQVNGQHHRYGTIIWRDRGDNVELVDVPADFGSTEVRVYWKGKTYKKHAYHGERMTVSFGNLPKGKKVAWRGFAWDDGEVRAKTKKRYFTE